MPHHELLPALEACMSSMTEGGAHAIRALIDKSNREAKKRPSKRHILPALLKLGRQAQQAYIKLRSQETTEDHRSAALVGKCSDSSNAMGSKEAIFDLITSVATCERP